MPAIGFDSHIPGTSVDEQRDRIGEFVLARCSAIHVPARLEECWSVVCLRSRCDVSLVNRISRIDDDVANRSAIFEGYNRLRRRRVAWYSIEKNRAVDGAVSMTVREYRQIEFEDIVAVNTEDVIGKYRRRTFDSVSQPTSFFL